MAEFINTVDIMGEDALVDVFITKPHGALTELKDDTVSEIGYYALSVHYLLALVDFPNLTTIRQRPFDNCVKLAAIILRGTNIARLVEDSANLFSRVGTTAPNGMTYVYVPRSMVDSYKSETNWSQYADRFRALEDYTVDGTTTGELDPTKI